MSSDEVLKGACHCGSVRFEVRLNDGLNTAMRCNCSMCRMRGAVAVTADVDRLRITEGEEHLSQYRFNTGVARHFFCGKCGIATHHQRRSNPHQFGVNAACLEGVTPFDFRRVPVTDGVHHVKDRGPGAKSRVVGYLSYDPVDEV